jgi:hypothetical protein
MAATTPFSIGVSFTTDFIIGAGGCLVAGAAAADSTGLPPVSVIFVAIVTGLMAGARRVQAMLEQPASTTKTTETDPSGAKREVTSTAPAGAAALPPDAPKGVTP